MQTDVKLRVDGYLLKKLTQAGLLWLDQNHEYVNRLNVFPVPDGDTGTNMVLTMREAYRAIEGIDDPHAGRVVAAVARGALNGARGNSGTILSQIWQGFAEVVRDHEVLEQPIIAEGFRHAVEKAYKSVSTPQEGTILTVAREIVGAVLLRIEDGEDNPVVLLKVMVGAGRASLRRTPNLLPVLKQAGVVDSGGQGLVFIFEGMVHAATGKTVVAPPKAVASVTAAPDAWQQALEPDDAEGYGYDVQFRMHGERLDVEAVRQAIEAIGWSAVVAGDSSLIKVHVHVHDPGIPLSYAIGLGVEIDDVVVENMQMQYHEFVQARADREMPGSLSPGSSRDLGRQLSFETTLEPPGPKVVDGVAVIAVAPGMGFRRLFLEDLGAARVITGGQTMNPSVGEFVEAIQSLPNDDIVLLPNNKNIILAAQQAATLVPEKRVRVVATRSMPQGISAMIAYSNLMANPGGAESADEAAEEMSAAAKEVVTAEVTTSTRSVEIGGVTVREGQLIGLVEGNLVVAGEDMTQVMGDVLRKADAGKRELVTLYYGNDTHKARAEALVDMLAVDFPGQTFDIVYGGQALYPYIISLE